MKHAIAIGAIAGILLAVPARAATPSIRIWDTDSNTSQAFVDLHATPAAIYRVVTDYARWPSLFSDVTRVTVLSGGPANATIEFESQTLDREVTVQFENGPENVRFHLVSGPPGVKSRGDFVVEPGPDASTTRVRGTLFMDASFPASLIVSDKKLVWMRQTKLRRDLEDLRKRFP